MKFYKKSLQNGYPGSSLLPGYPVSKRVPGYPGSFAIPSKNASKHIETLIYEEKKTLKKITRPTEDIKL